MLNRINYQTSIWVDAKYYLILKQSIWTTFTLKLIHILAVILFLGNIITGLFWMHIAVKTKDLKIINHTMNGIIKADRYFTIPGVIIITAGGFLAAIYGHFPILRSGWIFFGPLFCFQFQELLLH